MVKLLPRPQSALPRHESLDALLASPVDGIYFLQKQGGRDSPNYLQDCGVAPYVVKLVNPLLIPRRSIQWSLQMLRTVLRRWLGQQMSPLPDGLFYGRADLLVTADGHVIADSFSRGIFVHPGIVWKKDQTWEVPISSSEKVCVGRFQFLEIVPGHFGHMLVDMPGRLWHGTEPGMAALTDLPAVGFATHGQRPGLGVPAVAARILGALGIAPERITIATQPLRLGELIIASCISPHRRLGGLRYNRTMAKAGQVLAGGRIGAARFVFLSRSRLRGGRRPVDHKLAKRIDDLFARHGFFVVHPQDLDLADQIAVVRGASHLAGFIGSQMHLAAFSDQRHLQMLRLCPEDFVTNTDRKILAPLEGKIVNFVFKKPGIIRQLLQGMRLRPDKDDLDRLDTSIGAFISGEKTAIQQ